MDWESHAPLRDAARRRDYGQVINLARRMRGETQAQLGRGCGLSQSAVSRLETRGSDGPYTLQHLASAATHLGIPPGLVGLADDGNGSTTVQRRTFLTGVAALAAASALHQPDPPHSSATDDTAEAACLRQATNAYRRLDATVPSRDLLPAAHEHLRLIQRTTDAGPDRAHRARMAAIGSEAASLTGWLAWDMADHGSARRWYGAAVKAARTAGDHLLMAYQIGSLAQFEVEVGNAHEGLRLITRARRPETELPVIATAWLSSLEAVAHAGLGDQQASARALDACSRLTETIPGQEAPPWPWVFTFDQRKVAAARITSTARLGRPAWKALTVTDITTALSGGHAKQRALLSLDVATGQLASGRLESAFDLAAQALADGLRLRSGRVVERARTFRRGFTGTCPPAIVRDFDERLHDAYL
ncbi:helix-turn-helix domain-containing protein [Phaeacidiphilus oryzae]|uniref:helix-turn-helix domain-containing protein n=1 Tax=Phaeacidiphilus oryzae TaxID=348818 RepID=UPI000AFAC1AD|nr:helix-turn-helix transcriptional regulator [Phaeacidiphilus oryzae]